MGLTAKNTMKADAKDWAADELAHAFEHSITWEDDIWRADPVDVGEVLSLIHI